MAGSSRLPIYRTGSKVQWTGGSPVWQTEGPANPTRAAIAPIRLRISIGNTSLNRTLAPIARTRHWP